LYNTLSMKKYYILIILSLLACKEILANHTKGGWMYYEYLGPGVNDPNKLRYKIGINLYVECGTQVPEDNWTFSIFRGALPFTLIQDIPVSQTGSTTIQNCVLSTCYPCIDNVRSICYWIKNFEIIVELAASADGYIISKQRCCRVGNITNLQSPSNSYGETYTIKIPGSASPAVNAQQNSSPKFIFNDTALVCGNSYFSINFNATDLDGDSLVYSFCDAYHGGNNSGTGASPTPAAAPPYSYVTYSSPFSGTQPMGAGVTINNQTGVISGIAPAVGEYVVCVCVAEYRNGIYFADSRKEIHLYVGNCNPVSAKLKPRSTTCDGFSVDFSNAVENANPVGTDFLWSFGDPSSGAANTSTLPNPIHTYTDTGIFVLKLKVSLSGLCADSATILIKVYPGFAPDFTVTGQCKNTSVQFKDISTAAYGVIDSWKWNFGDLSSPTNTSVLQDPLHIYSTSANYNVLFTVTSSKGCIGTVPKTILITDKPALSITNDTLICIIDTLQLNAVGNGSFIWTPNYNINNLNISNPLVSPDITTTYRVTLTDPFGCVGSDSVKISVINAITQFAPNDTTICKTDSIILKLTSNALYYQWSEIPSGNSLNNPGIKNPVAIPLTSTTYHVVGSIGKCIAQNDINVKVVPYPNANAGIDQTVCFGYSAQLNASGGSIYTWSPAAFLNNRLIANPLAINPTANIRYIVTVTDTLGCPKPVKDTIVVFVAKITANAGPRDTAIVLDQPLLLQATGSTKYLWSPNQWLTNNAIANPVALPQTDIEYIVKVSNNVGCFDYDSIRVHLFKIDAGLYVPTAFTPNGDGLNDVFRPIILGMKSLNIFKVYNRWGQLLYSGTDAQKGWDGNFAGKGQDPATYVWYAEGTDYRNNKIKKKGYVVLIR
jgi:gliding motility-associated-like protein